MLSLQSDIAQAAAKLRSLTAAQQLPYAVSVAMNRVVFETQREVRAAMPQRFVLRSNWIVQGIRVDKATKQKLEASVYSRDKFMGLQEYGGPKHPHGNNLAVPTSLVRRSPKDRIRRSETPKALGDRVEVVQVGGRKFLALKKRRKGAGKNMLRLMYLLIPRAQLQERLQLNQDGQRIARAKFGQYLREALEQAIRTAR